MGITKLNWESDFFGFGIASLTDRIPSNLNRLINLHKIKLTWSLLDIGNTKRINRLQDMGFSFIDLKVTFAIKTSLGKAKGVRKAVAADISELRTIASQSFINDSRFNCKGFGKKKVQEFYSLWAEKAVKGTFDDCCLVAISKKKIAGFVTCRKVGEEAVIGLIAVEDNCRGLGIGSSLLTGCLDWAYRDGASLINVATEGKNLVAQNFYIKNGFQIKKIEGWYYKWVN